MSLFSDTVNPICTLALSLCDSGFHMGSAAAGSSSSAAGCFKSSSSGSFGSGSSSGLLSKSDGGEAAAPCRRSGRGVKPNVVADVAFRQQTFDWAPETFYYFDEKKGKKPDQQRTKWTALYPASFTQNKTYEQVTTALPTPVVENNTFVYDNSVWTRRDDIPDPKDASKKMTVFIPKSASMSTSDVSKAVAALHDTAATDTVSARTLMGTLPFTANDKEYTRYLMKKRPWQGKERWEGTEYIGEGTEATRADFIAAEKLRKEALKSASKETNKQRAELDRGKGQEINRVWTRSIFNPLRYYYCAMATQRNLWYYRDRLMVPRGPCSVATLKRCWVQGIVDGDTLIWGQGMMEFAPIKNVFTLTGQIRSLDVRVACALKKPFFKFAYWNARKQDWKNRHNISGTSQLDNWR